MTTETVSQNYVKTTSITTQKKDPSCNKKKKGVGNNNSPTPPHIY
jgi:hypothetical protein